MADAWIVPAAPGAEARLRADLAGMRRLYELQAKLAQETDLGVALDGILAAAVELAGTDRGTIQLVSDDGERLEIAHHRGYAPDSRFIEHFRCEGAQVGCDVVRRRRMRLLIEDVAGFPGLVGTKDGEVSLGDGVRAAQSTPLISRRGELVGVLSTQYRRPYRPSEDELRLIDMLAWSAADFVERHATEAALRRANEARQAFLLRLADALGALAGADEMQGEACRLLGEHLGVAGVAFGEADARQGRVAVRREWNDGRLASVAGGGWRGEDLGPAAAGRFAAGATAAVADTAAVPGGRVPAAPARGAFLAAPVVRQRRLAAALLVRHHEPRAWAREDEALVAEVCQRLWSAVERARAEEALREGEARLRIATEANGIGTWELLAREDGTTAAVTSPRHDAIFGYAEPVPGWDSGILLSHVLHEDREAVARTLRAAVEAGDAWTFEARIRLRREGDLRWIEAHGQPVERGAGGRAVRFIGVVQDITRRKAAEERQALLAREVDHRAKNALAVVQSVVRLTPAQDPATFRRAVEGRISALARAQTLLAEDRWTGADLRTLLGGELAPFQGAGHRVALEGPRVSLPPGAAQPLAMAAHELATNAVKHGALSAPAGRVAVAWCLHGGPSGTLWLRWAESGGPPVAEPPARRGFGSRVLDGTVRGQLGGAVSLAWESAGLVCEMRVPLGRDPASAGMAVAGAAAAE